MDFQQQKSYNILLIGDSCEDVYHYGTCERLSPEAPVPVLKQSAAKVVKGMSSNVRLNLESFQLNVHHITNHETIKKHRFIDSNHNQHLLRWDEGENTKLKPLDLSCIQDLNGFDALVISDYNKGFITSEICYELMKQIKKQNAKIPIFVDTKKINICCYDGCYVKINEKEFNNISSYGDNTKFIVTLGERGALYNNRIFPTKTVEVFDVCGAGDVFLSSLVAGYLKYGTIEQAIPLANKMASVSVSHMGTYVLTEDDIGKF